MMRRIVAALVLGLAAPAASADPVVMKNWFDDPYFPVRDGVRACPVPRGPFGTEEDMRRESHERAERGTTCWLAKKCEKPNAYLYDRDIAAAVKSRFDGAKTMHDASLWVTVQRRLVWVEGCVPRSYRDGALEALLKDVPGVEIVYVNVTRSTKVKPPYRVMPR